MNFNQLITIVAALFLSQALISVYFRTVKSIGDELSESVNLATKFLTGYSSCLPVWMSTQLQSTISSFPINKLKNKLKKNNTL